MAAWGALREGVTMAVAKGSTVLPALQYLIGHGAALGAGEVRGALGSVPVLFGEKF